MKRIIVFLLTAILLCTFSVPASAKTGSLVLIDAKNQRVLYEENKDERRLMASTTKIMTALLTLEEMELDKPFVVDPKAIRTEGSSMGLLPGDTVTLRTLAYGMLLSSGNDAANAAAVRISGSIPLFVKKMNERAKELGLRNTFFQTPSGLDADDHYSSAYDLAVLASEALKNPLFAEICGQSTAKVSFGDPPYDRWLSNHNRLLKTLPGVTGVKTGFTKKAGRCLVSSAERNGVSLICATLSCSDDWERHTKLYEAFFKELSAVSLEKQIPAVSIPVTGGTKLSVSASVKPITAALKKDEEEKVRVILSTEPFLFAPVEHGTIVGKARFYLGETFLAETVLTADETVERKRSPQSFGDRIADLWMLRNKK